jgi:hypothetical protein
MSGNTFEYDEDALAQIRDGKHPKFGGEEPKKNEDVQDTDIEEIEEDLDIEDHDEGNEEEPEYTAAQLEAMDQGWRPKDEWEGDPDQWVDEKEFLYRGELMGKISQLNKRAKSMEDALSQKEKTIKALTEHNKKMSEIEFKRALKQLKAEKRAALEDDEYDAADDIDDEIAELRKTQEELESAYDVTDTDDGENNEEAVPVISEEDQALLQKWATKNPWYNSNAAMHGAAEALASEYLTENPQDYTGMLRYVDRGIRKEFPHKFTRKMKGTTVTETDGRSAGRKKTGGKKKYSANDLTPEQLSVARGFESDGVMTLQEYAEDLAELGELPAQRGDR